jgi:hypothetical protein
VRFTTGGEQAFVEWEDQIQPEIELNDASNRFRFDKNISFWTYVIRSNNAVKKSASGCVAQKKENKWTFRLKTVSARHYREASVPDGI